MKKLLIVISILWTAAFSGAVHADDDRVVTVRSGQLKIVGEMNNMQLLFNGKKLGSISAAIGFGDTHQNKFVLGDRDVVLVEDTMGASCGLYFFVTIQSTPSPTATRTPTFGTCDDGAVISQVGNKILLTMKDQIGKTKKLQYENGTVTEVGKPVAK
jgi:hypothetical protein